MTRKKKPDDLVVPPGTATATAQPKGAPPEGKPEPLTAEQEEQLTAQLKAQVEAEQKAAAEKAAADAAAAQARPPLTLPVLEVVKIGEGAEVQLAGRRLALTEQWVPVVPVLFLETPDGAPRFAVLVGHNGKDGPALATAVATFHGEDRDVGEVLVDAACKPGPDGEVLDLPRRVWRLRAVRRRLAGMDRAAWGAQAEPPASAIEGASALLAGGAADRLHLELSAALGEGRLRVEGDP